jgi:Fe-S-cluster-containing dehydrogenase component
VKKWNLIIDVEECHNCNNCFLACKDEYVGNDIKGYSAPQPLHGHKWINIVSKERGQYPIMDIAYVPTMCNHCDDAPCVKQGQGAVEKRDDGIVIINPQKAVDRKDIVAACPYGSIWWNEEHSVPQAWTFDAHLLDRGWKEPRGVQSCPTRAMKAVKISDQEMASLVAEEKLEPLRPDLDTRPRVYYKNLHRYNKVFVAGEVLASVNDLADCVANAKVVLTSQGKELAATQTDPYGEFKIDGLEPECGPCTLSISHENFSTSTIDVVLDGQSVVAHSVTLETTP